MQGVSRLQGGDLNGALSHFSDVLIHDPDHAVVHFLLYQIFSSVADHPQTPTFRTGVIRLFHRFPEEMRSEVIVKLIASESMERIEREARALSSSDTPRGPLELRVALALQRYDLREAIDLLRRLQEIDRCDAPPNAVWAPKTQAYTLGRLQEILTNLELDVSPHLSRAHAALEGDTSLLHEGARLAMRGDMVRALPLLERVTSSMSSYESSMVRALTLAHLVSVRRDPELAIKALAAFSDAAEIARDKGQPLYWMGRLSSTLGAPRPLGVDEPLAYYLRAVERDPGCVEAKMEINLIYTSQGEFEKGLPWLQQCIGDYENRANAHPLGSAGIRFLTDDLVTCIGHATLYPDQLIKSRELGWGPEHRFYCLAPEWKVANMYLLKLWEPHITFITDERQIRELAPLARDLKRPISLTRWRDGTAGTPKATICEVQEEWERRGRGPLLSIPPRDKERGWEALRSLGLPDGARFVTLHVRDGNYKQEPTGSGIDRQRNADIRDYMAACEEIVARGFWIVRLGEPNSPRLPHHPQMIDYAHTPLKSPWMDVFLCAECDFFFGSSAGVIGVPRLFHKPVICTNFPHTHDHFNPSDLLIPKRLFSHALGRELTFPELSRAPFAESESSDTYQHLRVEPIDNSPEELREVAQEMMERVVGSPSYTTTDTALQNRYRAIFSRPKWHVVSRIGRDFLRRYPYLLDEPKS